MNIGEERKTAILIDLQIGRLKVILIGLQYAIKHLITEELSLDWYETMDEKKEHEVIYEMAFLAYKDYINRTIKHFYPSITNYNQFYVLKPEVELIIALTDFSKGYDPLVLQNTTGRVFAHFNIQLNNYPLYNGLHALNEKGQLMGILEILFEWRLMIIDLVYPANE